uniref:Uncharacterized protein n=1 Tax=Pipistrellus kuhlii TaxID=59472 RepID=A0A7J7XAQ4_PIPKU|nr:hypothetical protein mPipKuh1_010591 [Pipistrellus kuhlii]
MSLPTTGLALPHGGSLEAKQPSLSSPTSLSALRHKESPNALLSPPSGAELEADHWPLCRGSLDGGSRENWAKGKQFWAPTDQLTRFLTQHGRAGPVQGSRSPTEEAGQATHLLPDRPASQAQSTQHRLPRPGRTLSYCLRRGL